MKAKEDTVRVAMTTSRYDFGGEVVALRCDPRPDSKLSPLAEI